MHAGWKQLLSKRFLDLGKNVLQGISTKSLYAFNGVCVCVSFISPPAHLTQQQQQ